MVKTLHGAGIEVILDVVYNHTVEGEGCDLPESFKSIVCFVSRLGCVFVCLLLGLSTPGNAVERVHACTVRLHLRPLQPTALTSSPASPLLLGADDDPYLLSWRGIDAGAYYQQDPAAFVRLLNYRHVWAQAARWLGLSTPWEEAS